MYNGKSFALAAGMYLTTNYCKEHPNIKSIVFLSDSSSTLKNITNIKPHPSQAISLLFTKIAHQFLSDHNYCIELRWTKASRSKKEPTD